MKLVIQSSCKDTFQSSYLYFLGNELFTQIHYFYLKVLLLVVLQSNKIQWFLSINRDYNHFLAFFFPLCKLFSSLCLYLKGLKDNLSSIISPYLSSG